MKDVNVLATKVFGKDAEEVLRFMKEIGSEKEEFRNEESFMNYLGRELMARMPSKATAEENGTATFWECRKIALERATRNNEKPKNILYTIRLLNGKLQPPKPEPKEENILEDFWEKADRRRESWMY